MGEVEKIEHTYQVYERNRKVREAVLLRAKGRCEFCGQLGFRMDDGRRYLETHHVVPLYEGGDDNMENVIALCATHHREAHHAENRLDLRMAFVKRLADYRSRAVPA
jgi:5-methylcytosine-specific restriction protein A